MEWLDTDMAQRGKGRCACEIVEWDYGRDCGRGCELVCLGHGQVAEELDQAGA